MILFLLANSYYFGVAVVIKASISQGALETGV